MILGIDGHCIRGDGGSVTHLREVLRAADPAAAGFSKVVLWSGAETLARIEDRPWLEMVHATALDGALPTRSYWSARHLSKSAREAGCHVVWIPGCSFAGSFRPYVAMSRNMLPFEWAEMRRYGLRSRFWKFLTLRFSQSSTFRRSTGMIYLTEYARQKVSAVVGKSSGSNRVIPHGIDRRFAPRPHSNQSEGGSALRVLYVSVVDLYKHQWRVVEAVAQLQNEGFDVELTLIGPGYPPAEKKLLASLSKFKPRENSVKYLGPVAHSELAHYYCEADVFVYASSCENLPNILLEAMATGLPIASSDRGPMREILRDGGLFFDPEDSATIASAIRQYLLTPDVGAEKGRLALRYAGEYSWERCARETFSYLREVAVKYPKGKIGS